MPCILAIWRGKKCVKCTHAAHLNEKPKMTAAKSGFMEVNKGRLRIFPYNLGLCPALSITCICYIILSVLYIRIHIIILSVHNILSISRNRDHPSALLALLPKLPRSWLQFVASQTPRVLSFTVKSSREKGSNWLALEGNENLLSGYCACYSNALFDISTPVSASSPPQSSRVVCFFSLPIWPLRFPTALIPLHIFLYFVQASLNIFLQTERLQCATVF